jgi:argininosuccinate lyase
MSSRLWDIGQALDADTLRYCVGTDYLLDARLVPYDIQASMAHAEMLATQSLLTAEDLNLIRTGLTDLGKEYAAGQWCISLEDEDGQTALENRLTQRIGSAGGRIHLGRSRNDQVLTALRLYLRDAIHQLSTAALEVAVALEEMAQRDGAIVIPGYTHMQQAMPSSVALWAVGFAEEIRDDANSLLKVRKRLEKCPLGSAAGYGTPGISIDRVMTCRKLGFAMPHDPVTAVQLSRGKAEAQLLFELSLLMQDLGRFAADVLLFYSKEFGFIGIAEAFTTGSSIMPQKRNPDVFELIRANGVVVASCLSEAISLYTKLPSGYQRDLQLLKQPLFRGIDYSMSTLKILPRLIQALYFIPQRIKLDPAIHSAEAANRLASRTNLPFREAYRQIAQNLVQHLDEY